MTRTTRSREIRGATKGLRESGRSYLPTVRAPVVAVQLLTAAKAAVAAIVFSILRRVERSAVLMVTPRDDRFFFIPYSGH